MSLPFCRLTAAAFAAGLVLGTLGCGDGKEKVVIPEKFTPPPPNGPSVTGAPAPDNTKGSGKKAGKGAAPADL